MKNVVIVGGGFGGTSAAAELSRNAGLEEVLVTLIDTKDFFDVNFAATRGGVDEAFGKTISMPHDEWMSNKANLTLLRGRASNVTPEVVVLENGDSVSYDYLVLATGSSNVTPMKTQAETLEGRHIELADMARTIAAAKHVLVIGGGPVGVELAGEILHAHPGIKLTHVSRSLGLLPSAKPKAGERIAKALGKYQGYTLITGDTVDFSGEVTSGNYVTGKGVAIDGVDLVIPAVGGSLNTAWLRDSVVAEALNEKNELRVNKWLQVEGLDNIFAVGDINNLNKAKLGAAASPMGSAAAKNIKRLLNGKTPNATGGKLPDNLMFVAISPTSGVCSLPFGVFTSLARVKSGSLFVGRSLNALRK